MVLPAEVGLAPGSLVDSQFVEPGLQVTTANMPLQEVYTRLQNHAAWRDFIVRQNPSPVVHIDPRSGTPSSIILRSPIVPGSANQLTLQDLRAQLGRDVQDVTSDVVADLVMQYIADNSEMFAIALDQLGPGQVTQVTDSLWQISIPQVAGNVPVRHGRLVATINHGNLVLIGTEIWGNAAISTAPNISGDEAITIGFSHVGGRLPDDRIYKQPVLEIVPIAPPGRELAYDAVTGVIGGGYGHRLVWSFGFERTTDLGRWELLIDAHAGEVISLYDNSSHAKRRIRGWVYPMTNTGVCPSIDRCGTIQDDYPMPWADYGPSLYSNGAGVFEFGGSATTTLKGKYVRFDPPGCGQLAVPGGDGDITLGLGEEIHDCPEPLPQVAGDSPAARTAFYEANKIAEIARGWVPGNPWLNGDTANCPRTPIKVHDNHVGGSCLAQYANQSTPSTISFGKTQDTPSDCRNLGEIATVVSHEWAHGLDDNDLSCTGDNLSKPREAYADIAAIYRHQASCFGYGKLKTTTNVSDACPPPPDYPLTTDQTGKNARENIIDVLTCDTDCSGYRDADYTRHDHDPSTPGDPGPDTPQNWVCKSCPTGSPYPSPCAGRQVHCAAAPITQAAWDLVKPGGDLRSPPFSYDSVTAFIIGNKLFYQGSENIGFWHACDCGLGISDGCGAGSGYMNWLAADDDNGNLNDGTPHMTALYAAFNRHGIACTANILAAADHRTTLGRIVSPSTYLDTRTSNNIREVLEEGYDDGVSRLEHVWKFDGLQIAPRTLIVEGYRPNNSENDNFQFYYSTDDVNWTLIPNAKIDKVLEPAGGIPYPFGGASSATMYIKVEDTSVLTGPILDKVYVDYLAIGQGAPVPQNSGCYGGPAQAPSITTMTPGPYQATLVWSNVAGAVKYWVLRTEGHAGCDLGMALIAKVPPAAPPATSTSYTDDQVAAGRQYCYVVMAAGGDGSEGSGCFSAASACQCVTPTL